MQFGLFDGGQPAPARTPVDTGPEPELYGLRWYQAEAYHELQTKWREARSLLTVLATGLGKTQLFGAVALDWATKFAPLYGCTGDVLVLAHRDELVQQAAARIRQMSRGRVHVEIEQAELRASSRARIVVGSIQSVTSQQRLDRMGKERFGLVIADEAHHYVAKSFRRPLDYFEDAKVMLVTATPDRGDEKAMGQICDDVAYAMDISDGVEQGYLVPIRGEQVFLREIDLSEVKASNAEGGLNIQQLDEAMLKAVEGIVHETVRLHPDRQGIAFFPGVKSAEYAAAAFNRLRPGSAAFVSGSTPDDERQLIMADYKRGRYKYLCNCQIATEGFDAPTTSMVIMGRPTKSRALYAQCGGRGTRVLEGVVDGIAGKDGAERRRAAIAASAKPDLMILDFYGNAGRHSLCCSADMLGGDYTEEEVKVAKERQQKGDNRDVRQVLQAARAEVQALANRHKVAVKAEVQQFDPFRLLHIKQPADMPHSTKDLYEPAASDKQLASLRKAFGKLPIPENLSRKEASRLLNSVFARREKGLATPSQLSQLGKFGINDINVRFANASRAIDYIANETGWGRKARIDPNRLQSLLYGN